MSTLTDENMMRQWMKENELRKVQSITLCFRKIAGLHRKGCKYWGSRTRGTCIGLCEKSHFPFMDHLQYFKKTGVPGLWLVSHPYSYRDEDMEVMERVRSEYGLVTEVFDREQSWYYPGSTYLVVIRPGE